MSRSDTYGQMMQHHLRVWADTGATPTAHVVVGKVNGREVLCTVREAPRAALQDPPGNAYTAIACQIERSRRGPPSGWRYRWDGNVLGWLCTDVKEGWRPILPCEADLPEVD